MEGKALQDWIGTWSAKYPADDDVALEPLAGLADFGPDELVTVYNWKFTGLWPRKKIAAMKAMPPDTVRALTKRAFACNDELGALCITELVPGAGPAGASAILMAQDPVRYTVMDVRALASLKALGRLTAAQGSHASPLLWTSYLAACRGLAVETGTPLRDVDRALWAANGHLE